MGRSRAFEAIRGGHIPDYRSLQGQGVAQVFGVTPAAVSQWRAAGCPSKSVTKEPRYNLTEVILWRLERASQSGGGIGSEEDPDSPLPPGVGSWRQAIEKEKAIKARIEREALEGELISREEVEAGRIRRVTAITQSLEHLVHDLPPVLEGHSAREIEGILEEYVREIRTAFGGQAAPAVVAKGSV